MVDVVESDTNTPKAGPGGGAPDVVRNPARVSRNRMLHEKARDLRKKAEFVGFNEGDHSRDMSELGCQEDHDDHIAVQTLMASDAPVLDKPIRLINSNCAALVIVDGTGADYKITEAERANIVAQWQEACDWITAQRPEANISWDTEIYETAVNITPWKGARFKGLPNYDGMSAMFTNSNNGRIYGFETKVRANSSLPLPRYFRISSVSSGVDAGYPKDIGANWTLPAEFNSGVDAACYREGNQKIYLIRGENYVRVDPETFAADAGYPKKISDGWKNVPVEFADGPDAVLCHKTKNHIYMFKGSKYIKFASGSSTMAPGYPKDIAGNWGNADELGKFVEGISCAFWRDSNSKIYLFRNSRWGGKYLRVDPETFDVDSGYSGGVHIGLSSGDAEALWRDPALKNLGFGEGGTGIKELALATRDLTNAQNAIVVFVTKWPVGHHAYAGGHRFVYSKPDLTKDFSPTMAHEALHLYGAVDEYLTTSSCSKTHGRFFTAKNSNSVSCDNSPQDCLMGSGSGLCAYSQRHVGWGAFETQIDAAVTRGPNGKTYLFSGSYYIR